MTEWVDVHEYPGYQVSRCGQVRNARTTRLKAQHRNYAGYARVTLVRCKKQSNVAVHRLVARAFLPDWDPALTVDHVNRDQGDNRAENLRLATYSDQNKNRAGVSGAARVPVHQTDHDGAVLRTYDSASLASLATGIGVDAIRACACGQRREAGGFRWAYPARVDVPGEVWVPVGVASDGLCVSNKGRYVRRLRGGAWTPPKDARRLSARGGYPVIKVGGKTAAFHRVVASAFLGPPPDSSTAVVNHRDGDRGNAHADNLEWCSASHNALHAIRLGARQRTPDLVPADGAQTDPDIFPEPA
jgi:hypothetical protein